jgi:Mg/Co/Ni transporter MgtE
VPAEDTLCNAFLTNHPADAARVLEELTERSFGRFLSRCDPVAAASLLAFVDPSRAAACLTHMTPRAGVEILSRLPPQRCLALLRRLTEKRRESYLALAPDHVTDLARRMLAFPRGSVGEWMETDVLTLPDDIGAGEALRRLRRAKERDRADIYVLDRALHLVGMVTPAALVRAPRDETVSSFMRVRPPRLAAHSGERELLESRHWLEHVSVAVVDEDGVFVGVVDHKTVAHVRARLAKESQRDDTLDTALALGRLYWLGLSGVMEGIAYRSEDRGGQSGQSEGDADAR